MNLLLGILASGVVGSVIFGILLLLRLITNRIFSKTWHYYCLLIPLVFLLGGGHFAVNLMGIMPRPALEIASPSPESQGAAMLPPEIFVPPVLDGSAHVMPAGGGETEVFVILPSTTPQLIEHVERIIPFLLVLWILGAAFFITTGARKYLQYRRLVLRNAKCVTDIDCKIPVVISAAAHTPMLLGVVKPVIVLPNMYFADEELEMILAHEMVHYSRKDLLVKLMVLIANAIHWYNPAVYALNRQINAMCELSCDEKVVSHMDAQNRNLYGKTLLQVLQHSSGNLVGNVAFATNLFSSKKNFKRRLISMMQAKKMKKSMVALALATGLLLVGGGFVISNVISSAMPVHAGETAQYDTSAEASNTSAEAPDTQAPASSITISPSVVSPVDVNPPAAPVDAAPDNRYLLFGLTWEDDYTWEFGPIGYVSELPFTLPPITDESELPDFVAHHSLGNIMLPSYIPQGYNFHSAEYSGWRNHLFTAVTDMPEDVVRAVADEAYIPLFAARLGVGLEQLGNVRWMGSTQPLDDGGTRLIYMEEASLIDGFDWEMAAMVPDFDSLSIAFTRDISDRHFTAVVVEVHKNIWGGWYDAESPGSSWQHESPITINGIDGFISENAIRLLDPTNNATYTISSNSIHGVDQDTLIRIAESLS